MTESSSDTQQALDPALLREVLAGYAAANDVVEAERQATLLRMTREEALAIWRDLMTGFNEHPERHRQLDRLDLWQAEGLVTLRSALDRMAKSGKKP